MQALEAKRRASKKPLGAPPNPWRKGDTFEGLPFQEDDPQRLAPKPFWLPGSPAAKVTPKNWDVYADSAVSDFLTTDPDALPAPETHPIHPFTGLAPSENLEINGKRTNGKGLEHLRNLYTALIFCKLVENDDVTVSTLRRDDPNTGGEVFKSRWIATLTMNNRQATRWRLPGLGRFIDDQPDKRMINIEAVATFYFNAEDKLYRQLIEEVNILVDGEPVDVWEMHNFVISNLPLTRLPFPWRKQAAADEGMERAQALAKQAAKAVDDPVLQKELQDAAGQARRDAQAASEEAKNVVTELDTTPLERLQRIRDAEWPMVFSTNLVSSPLQRMN